MFKVKFFSPNGFYQEKDATLLNVFTSDGQRGILSNHMPLVLPLIVSRLELINNKQKDYYAIGGGVIYFKDNEAYVVVESVEHKDDINITRANAAKDRALKRLESNDSNIDIKRAQAALSKALNRINVYNLK